jgi:LmbE family N-acetylglucosaminyl deacetylase
LKRHKILAVAPHPDDETLGCGGSLLRYRDEGAELAWLIVTGISEDQGWDAARVRERDAEVDTVAGLMGFSEVFRMGLPAAQLDTLPMASLVAKLSAVFQSFEPDEVLLPHRSDVHTDHRIVFDAAAACTKWFRYPSVRRVLAYETISETDFGLDADRSFRPNSYVDISSYIERKLEVMAVYKSELNAFPFPRSIEAIKALAHFRGASSGFGAAEAFQLLRERR